MNLKTYSSLLPQNGESDETHAHNWCYFYYIFIALLIKQPELWTFKTYVILGNLIAYFYKQAHLWYKDSNLLVFI